MVRIVRRNNRPPLMTCLIVVFAFAAVGIMVIAGIVIAFVFLSAESPGSSPTGDSSPAGGSSSVGPSSSVRSSSSSADTDDGSTAAPVSGGWSSGG